ncbi:uncharacterized protein GLRG_01056 [Colletotrichum graminicola M1.001]|uniref:TLC domain-containing protein n=1 Tax=Colletotrichum graminicola (strain M1.001 / M2 / FGSC 10212) TaxID=645133 RepID=E3Q5E5_COLGM|nr:uncharacterized protein GLRG_01056 [Colletotrichum graminicola M1.001]EFQ25912.1 hypothetical protein GLRG_01056 [Colletotrichum graminicola M1.001]
MDVIELIFLLAKCLKYVGFTTLCDVVFGVFLCVWAWTRHVFYLMVCWSVYYDLLRSLEQLCFWGAAEDVGFLTFLLALEVVICVWSFLIIWVIIRVLKGASAEDVRSDVEEEEEEEEVQVVEDVGVDSIDLKAWERRTAKRTSGLRASGVSIHLSQSDRKELLNRIGCEKQIE